MSWDNWNSNDFPNSARKVFELSEKKEREELAKRQVKEKEQSIENFKHEQNIKLEESKFKFEKEKLEFEKLKEKNNWKRSIVTWGISSVAIVVSIISLIISLT